MEVPRALRVLHVAQPTDAGVARCVADFAGEQRAHGLDARVACPPAGPLTGWLRERRVPYAAWPATRSPGPTVAAETLRLRRVLRAFAPDLVHLHSSKAGLAGRLALRGAVPTVFQPHAWSFAAVTGPVHAASLAWERAAARWADTVVCVSDAERADGVAAGVRARRWDVVPNGVDLARWQPGSRTEARRRLGLPDGPLVVCVGRLSRQKGQDVLLRAWADVPGATLALVGDGPLHDTLAAAAPSSVLLAGRRDDVADWYAAADVVALPSRWEGLALTALEALACGRPVVASDVTGMREVVDPAGLVPPDDPAALAAALAELLADPDRRVKLGAAASTRADDFSVDA
ncbi:MAG TPA: glycosyltransferase, partial [Mycobacteriales bacterium]|nr:glycosyltransferase [Mycobacteriales bacterium]